MQGRIQELQLTNMGGDYLERGGKGKISPEFLAWISTFNKLKDSPFYG